MKVSMVINFNEYIFCERLIILLLWYLLSLKKSILLNYIYGYIYYEKN